MSHLMQQTSLDAYDSIQSSLPRMASKLFGYIEAAGDAGRTSHEIVAESGVGIQTVSGVLRGITLKGLIEDSGERRPAPSGRKCIVWKKAA
jgi:hypothetical protein